MIKEIHNTINNQQRELQEVANIIYSNSMYMLVENDVLVCETVVSFLYTLGAVLKHKFKNDITDNDIRNRFGILAALDLLRYPQSRKTIDSNSIRDFLSVMLDVEGVDPLQPIELKLLRKLPLMINDEGVSGIELQSHYLKLVKTNPKALINIIDKLKKQYTHIIDKIHHSSTTYSTHPSTDVENVI